MSKIKDELIEACTNCDVNNELADLEMKYEFEREQNEALLKLVEAHTKLCSLLLKQNEQLKEKVDVYERCRK